MSETKEEPQDLEEVGVEEAPAPEEAPVVEEKASLGVALDANQVILCSIWPTPLPRHNRLLTPGFRVQFPQVVMLIAGMVLLIALGAEYDWNFNGTSYQGYALSISIIAMVLSLVNLLTLKFAKGIHDKHGSHVNYLLFCYNFVGACFLTFEKPFSTTSNGYFASWALVYGSAMSLGMKQAGLGSKIRGLGAVVGLLASALVVVIATIKPVSSCEVTALVFRYINSIFSSSGP